MLRKDSHIPHLLPLRTSRISEISELTSSVGVSDVTRVNFHIGNPVQDIRLQGVTLALLAGNENPGEHFLWPLILKATTASIPYAPRGGYQSHKITDLIKAIHTHLLETEREGLEYNMGENGDPREIILCSGGFFETLRVLFRVLNTSLDAEYARIIPVDCDLSLIANDYSRLRVIPHPKTPESLFFKEQTPVFFIFGKILTETERKQYRQLALQFPVMFVEINNAPNHLSLSREAGLRDHVLRFLSASVFDSRLAFLPVVTVLGNSTYLQYMETLHFELKGTPSTSEICAMESFIMGETELSYTSEIPPEKNDDPPPFFGIHLKNPNLDAYWERTQEITKRLLNNSFIFKNNTIANPLAPLNREELLDFYGHLSQNPEKVVDLENSFLAEFLRSYPFYSQNECCVVSGSARTALSLLGQHCGIEEVVISDISWNYEHAFPVCHPVPSLPDLYPDAAGILKTIDICLQKDPTWCNKGAVIVNTPHNATGLVWRGDVLDFLIKELTARNVRIIDDLSYYGIAPSEDFKPEPSLRERALKLNERGIISNQALTFIITVHSLSKTDCLAGVRLAVAHIPDKKIRQRFQALNAKIEPNPTALLIGLLLYKNSPSHLKRMRVLRNQILNERMNALKDAEIELPSFRNQQDIVIHRPEGAMYPRLEIKKLPQGVSIDLLATELAAQGIGLIPLTAFARTSFGYATAYKSFRLTLGGSDSADDLHFKTRRMIIDLNRIIQAKAASVQRIDLPKSQLYEHFQIFQNSQWNTLCKEIIDLSLKKGINPIRKRNLSLEGVSGFKPFLEERIQTFTQQFKDACSLKAVQALWLRSQKSQLLMQMLQDEFYKEMEEERIYRFKHRLFDRTVHPTQIHALPVERDFRKIIELIVQEESVPASLKKHLAQSLVEEFLGENVAISSSEEAYELILDVKAWQDAESWLQIKYGVEVPVLLSFWSDWDGSSRPSGQGHRLAAAVVLYDVQRMAQLLKHARKIDPTFIPDETLWKKVQHLDETTQKFWKLLNRITDLTAELAKRYQSLMPYDFVAPTTYKKVLGKVGLWKDPAQKIWQHNDKLEKQMLKLREKRRFWLDYYFSLNKQLRKEIHDFIPRIAGRLDDPTVTLPFIQFKSAVKRVALTPRIHQKQILDRDQFAIDTTVYNICEINYLAQKTGHPRFIPALQISMSDTPKSFITLDRKFTRQREMLNRNVGDIIPPVWLIPLFEDKDRIITLRDYLDELWAYAMRTRKVAQSEKDRFKEMVCEFFIAGSDLSQQMGQPGSQELYQKARVDIKEWLAMRELAADVRVKLGSGEPMQRQGGYYDPLAGNPLVVPEGLNFLPDGPLKLQLLSARFPLRGIWQGREFRTFQSTVSETIRNLNLEERVALYYHLVKSSGEHAEQVRQMNETFQRTRNRSVMQRRQMIEFIYGYTPDKAMDHFVELHTRNFRQILYGREDDLTGLHLVSYFLSRIVPTLRDRPTVRPVSSREEHEVLQRLAGIIPMAESGSMLRAIGHQRSQTVMIGVNQLSTGLFRAFRQFVEDPTWKGEGPIILRERILSRLPCLDILKTLRLYQDPDLRIAKEAALAFPPGNSAFAALEEDHQLIAEMIPLLQEEVLRRLGLPVQDILVDGFVDPDIISTLHPEIAVLMQADFMNRDIEQFLSFLHHISSKEWLQSVSKELEKPRHISEHRDAIWEIVSESVLEKIKSFNELAAALNILSNIFPQGGLEEHGGNSTGNLFRQVLRMPSVQEDDRLRMLLMEAVRILRQATTQETEIPVDVLRVIRDVQQIIKMEETPLKLSERTLIQAHLLAIARLTGENG
ncbi:MAG: pyridoxal phosphate-dependent aminotransferase [Candidatus Marinimicrobia bacterium]|nr:pyridoxal phosphate-dependent aminotransferase [Candidatus Neomarinimicrobiota bacterium]